jgi:DNA repair protein RadC
MKKPKQTKIEYSNYRTTVQGIPCTVRESTGTLCTSPEEVAKLFVDLRDRAQECFCVATLDTRKKVIARHVITIGTLDAALVHSREAFRAAIMDSAQSVILVHNHPSGDPTPSTEDIKITRRMIEAGEILELPVLDHIIIGKPRYAGALGFMSLRESDLLKFGY